MHAWYALFASYPCPPNPATVLIRRALVSVVLVVLCGESIHSENVDIKRILDLKTYSSAL